MEIDEFSRVSILMRIPEAKCTCNCISLSSKGILTFKQFVNCHLGRLVCRLYVVKTEKFHFQLSVLILSRRNLKYYNFTCLECKKANLPVWDKEKNMGWTDAESEVTIVEDKMREYTEWYANLCDTGWNKLWYYL